MNQYNKALDNGAGGPDEISDIQQKSLIAKFQRKGFDSLSLEEVATALIIPNFAKTFQQHTGLDWGQKFEVKAYERLSKSKFDIQWMARKDGLEHSALFVNCARGDLLKVRQYLKDTKDPQIKLVVDQTKKSPLHIVCIEGHLTIVELLLMSGFNPNARDRTLKTPLHYASLHGHETIADTLLKAGADIMARDSLGRSSIHFAASCPSAQLLQLLLAMKPELANDLDHRRRSPLHYCVWNSSQHQVNLLRTLLDFRGNPLSLDEDLKTPIHHASEGGKTRAIPILLQRGGQESIQMRDRNQKTPLELAQNERTREVIIVYSSSPMNHNQDDIKYLSEAIQGNKLGNNGNKKKAEEPEMVIKKQFPVVDKEIVQVDAPETKVKWTPSSMNQWIREKFFTIMKKVQESGIKANHHLKKPFVYTGSWMEGINSMEELYGAVKDIPAGEACVRTFNILCPFDRGLPQEKGLEDIVDGFYGEMWFDGSSSVTRTEQVEEMRRKMQQEYLLRITELETQIQIKSQHLFDTDQELAQTKANLEVQQRREKTNETKWQGQIDGLNKQLKLKDDQILKLQNDLKKQEKLIESIRNECEELRNQPQGISEEEQQQYQQEILELKEQLLRSKDDEKNARIKVGQLFMNTLTNQRTNQEEKYLAVKKELEIANTKIAALSTEKQKLSANYQMQKQQIDLEKIKEKEKQQIIAQALPENAVGGMDNLQDDDALIILLKALKGNPPPMKQRMKQVDSDLDGKLTQEEFRTFLTTLKISQQDIHSLSRIAGFMSGKKLLGIDEFVQILQDRPKQREQFEQALFCKLLDAIKTRGLTIEKLFELIDTDGSGTLSPAEMKLGLKSLKIILNQKDLNNMFCIFDSDKSGQISLTEMKQTLDHYQQLRQQQGDQQDVELEEQRIQTVDEENPFSDIDSSDQELIQEFKEWVIDPVDFTKIHGKLKIQLVSSTQMNAKSIYCIIILKGAGVVDRQFILFNPTTLKQALFIDIPNILQENICEYLWIQLFSNEYSEPNFIGDIRIIWKQCLKTPNQYVINNKFQLKNTTYIKEKSKMFQPNGSVNIQVKFIPTPEQNEENQQMAPAPTPNQFIGTIVEEGLLEIVLIQCILTEEQKNLKEPKYFCHLQIMSINEKVLAKTTAKNDLFWEQKFQQELKCVTQIAIPAIHCKVYAETPKNLFQSNTILFGDFYVNWNECIIQPGEYLSHKSFQLGDVQCKMYLKIRYIPQSMFQQIIGFKQGVSTKEKKKQLTMDDMQTGTLKILFVRGKNLRADDGDTSDPYCICKVLSLDKEIKLQSKTIKKTLNPEWRDLQQIKNLLLPKEAPYPPLELEVFDEDLVGDDALGSIKVDLAPAVESPCSWAINNYFDIKDPKATLQGQIYIQCYWVPQGTKDPNIKPKDKNDSSGCVDPDPNFIDGTLVVKVMHGREIQAQNPDPYVTITFPGNKELKTETISSTVNPIFNQALQNTFKVPKENGTIPLKVLVKDSNFLTDAIIGFVDVAWNQCVAKPGEWAINQVFNLSALSESKQFGSIGYLYLQVKFLERGMIDDNAEAPMVENLFDIINSKQGLYQGTLRVFLVHARNLVIADETASDPYVVFKVPGGKKVETQAKKNTLNPSWKTIFPVELSMPKDTIQPLRVEVYDDDLIGDEIMGYTIIDLLQCFQNPQVWKFNEVMDLYGDLKMQQKYRTKYFGKIYLQIMFCIQGIQNNDPPLPLTEDLDNILREQQQENKKPIKGQLFINIPVALGLKADDGFTSDPYCKLTFPDKLKISTKMIEKTLNPIFNFQYKWNCNILKEQYAPIKIEVFDSDKLSDDLLDTFSVEWMDCFKNPTVWQVNQLFPLKEGKVYVQSKFLLPGTETTPEGIRACDTLAELKNDYGRVLGKINVKIISAQQLYNADVIGKSDPFVECFLSSETKKMKTPILEDTLDPVWNFEGTLNIDFLRCQIQANTIQFNVFDDDEIGTEFLGSTQIDLIEILEKNPNSVQTFDLPLKDPKKKGNPNLGSLKLSLSWLPDPYNEGVVGLRVPPKMYTGDLYIRFPNARQLPKGDPFVKFYLTYNPEKSYECKHQDSQLNPDFDFETIIAVDLSERQILTERIKASVIDYNVAWKNTVLGSFTLQITDCFHKNGEWLNQYVQLSDDNGKLIESYLYILVQFRQKDTQIDTNLPQLIDFQTFINAGKPPVFGGKLLFKYIGLKNLKNMDITGLSDPFVEIKLSKGSKSSFKTTTQDDTLECYWSDPGEYVFKDLLKEDFTEFVMYITAFDYDYKSNDILGKTEYKLNTIKSGQWINERIPLLDENNFPQKSEIYIQALYQLDGDESPIQPQPPNLYEEMVKKQQMEVAQQNKIKQEQAAIPKQPGILRVFCVYATNLKKTDTFDNSDPYVEFKLSKGSKEILKTPTIDNNLNPKWNYQKDFQLDMQPQEYKDIYLMTTVSDYDTIVSSDFLGFIEIDLNHIFETPGIWINQLFQLKDEFGNTGKNGEIYIKVQWVPNHLKSKISLQEPIEQDKGITQTQQQQQQQPEIPQTGQLQINVIKILGFEKKSQIKFKFDNSQVCDKVFSTNLVQKGVDYNLRQLVDIRPIKNFKIFFQLFDESQLQIADFALDLTQLIQIPGTWINDYYGFEHTNLSPNIQKLYLQIQYRPCDKQIDTQEPEIKPEPKIVIQQEGEIINLPRGKIKIGVVKAENIVLLDGGKTSNTKVSVYIENNEKSTGCVKGGSPIWNSVLDAFSYKSTKIEELKMCIKVFHDPGWLKSCIQIGEVAQVDLLEIFKKPNNWSIKNDFPLSGLIKDTKQMATGFVTVWIGFVPEKDKDTLIKI